MISAFPEPRGGTISIIDLILEQPTRYFFNYSVSVSDIERNICLSNKLITYIRVVTGL